MSEVIEVIVWLLQWNKQFNGKDMSCYPQDCKVEMLQCRISEGLQVTSFNRVAKNGLEGSIHRIRQQNLMWATFEEVLKTTFVIEDSKATQGGFEKIGWKH